VLKFLQWNAEIIHFIVDAVGSETTRHDAPDARSSATCSAFTVKRGCPDFLPLNLASRKGEVKKPGDPLILQTAVDPQGGR
jgi:hypothetical protein